MKTRLYLRTPKKDQSAIMMNCAWAGQYIRISTGISIDTQYWDNKNKCLRRAKGFANRMKIEKRLKDLESQAAAIYAELASGNKVPSKKDIKDSLEVYLGRKVETAAGITFWKYLDQFIERRDADPKYKPNTIRTYVRLKNTLTEFQKVYAKTIDFHTIDLAFYDAFKLWMTGVRQYSTNTMGQYVKLLKVVLNDATDRGVNRHFGYKKRTFKKPSQDTDYIYLSEAEIRKLYKLRLDHAPGLDRARDAFVIGCYTGLRFGDVANLSPEQFQTIQDDKGRPYRVLRVTTEKTGTTVVIPLRPEVEAILQKRDGLPPNVVSNQKVNKHLKTLGQLAEIDEEIELAKSKAGKRILVKMKRWEAISTHTARRSFATNAFKAGVSSLAIMKITGHKTESAFMRYIRVSEEENAIIMAQNPFFKGGLRKIG